MKKIPTSLFALSLLLGFAYSSEAFAQTSTTTSTVHSATAVEAKVREFFPDTPAMVEIARCESKFRQFTDSGNVLRGGAGGQMVGVFQFFERIHTAGAKALGFDITTLEGNLGYAKYVYQTQGTTPWNSARSCWEHATNNTLSDTALTTLAEPKDQAELKNQITLLLELISVLETLLELKQQVAQR